MRNFIDKYAALEDIMIDADGLREWRELREEEKRVLVMGTRVRDNRQVLIKWRELLRKEKQKAVDEGCRECRLEGLSKCDGSHYQAIGFENDCPCQEENIECGGCYFDRTGQEPEQ